MYLSRLKSISLAAYLAWLFAADAWRNVDDGKYLEAIVAAKRIQQGIF